MSNYRPELIICFETPPRAGAGAFSSIPKLWGNKVYYLCDHQLGTDRRKSGWEDCYHGGAELIFLSEKQDPEHFVRNFIREHSDAIYVGNGLRSTKMGPYIKKHLLSFTKAKIAMWSEPPGVYGTRFQKIKRILTLRFIYRYYAMRYGNIIRAYFPLGTLGVNIFAKWGWDRNILHPFMYAPQIPQNLPKLQPRNPNDPLHFLYVGRFNTSTKGVDLIVRAFNKVHGENWSLDLVGRNGDYEQQMIAWADTHPRVSYLGIWPSSEVISRISQYDVCLVPSRFDGWNVVTNESLWAGVGVIASDAAVSDELIRSSGAGIVVPSGNAVALKDAIQYVIDNPDVVDVWKEKAKAFTPRITSDCIGKYFIDVLDYTFMDSSRPRPVCPWL